MALVAFVTKAGRPVVFRTGKRANPSIRQRLRSSQKHLVAQKGRDLRDRPDAQALVAMGKRAPGGLVRRHRLKQQRKTGTVRSMAGRLT